MPSHSRRYAGVKIATVAPGNPALGLPRIQGTYLLLDAETLSPLAVLDGVALTAIRTAAVSAAAADLLAVAEPERLVVFGTGPQAHSHVEALRAIRPTLRHITVVGRDEDRLAAFLAQYGDAGPTVEAGAPDAVARADLVACCTTARAPPSTAQLCPRMRRSSPSARTSPRRARSTTRRRAGRRSWSRRAGPRCARPATSSSPSGRVRWIPMPWWAWRTSYAAR